MKKCFALMVVLCLFLYLPGMVVAQDKEPDAYLELTEGSVAIGIGYSWGDGTLTYQGTKYPWRSKDFP